MFLGFGAGVGVFVGVFPWCLESSYLGKCLIRDVLLLS